MQFLCVKPTLMTHQKGLVIFPPFLILNGILLPHRVFFSTHVIPKTHLQLQIDFFDYTNNLWRIFCFVYINIKPIPHRIPKTGPTCGLKNL